MSAELTLKFVLFWFFHNDSRLINLATSSGLCSSNGRLSMFTLVSSLGSFGTENALITRYALDRDFHSKFLFIFYCFFVYCVWFALCIWRKHRRSETFKHSISVLIFVFLLFFNVWFVVEFLNSFWQFSVQ